LIDADGVRSSISVVADPGTGVLRVNRKMRRRFGPVLRPQIPARRFARCFGLTRWRNEELFTDISRQRVAQSLIDSARLAGVEHRWAGGLFPGNDRGQNNPEKNLVFNQLLTRKAQSHLRVICATPF
jgi:hypothetical protein